MDASDMELLTLAARAAGIHTERTPGGNLVTEREDGQQWAPLWDDGDAFRLAVALRLTLRIYDTQAEVFDEDDTFVRIEPCAKDPLAATRRAIVRAAAEIGKALASADAER